MEDSKKIDLSGLDEIYGGKPVNLEGLEDVYKSNEEPKAIQTAKDAFTGAGETLGVSQQIGGAAQGIPDAAMSVLHNMIPGLADASPSQVNAALKSMGFKGDLGPTSSAEMYKQGTKDVEADQNAGVQRSPIAYRGGELAGLGLGAAGAGMAGKGLASAASALPGAGAISEAGAAANNALQAAPAALRIPGNIALAAAKAAPLGALYGGLGSSGSVIGGTPQEQQQALGSMKTGAEIGGALGGAGSLMGQAGGAFLKNTEAGKRLSALYGLGEQGKDLSKAEAWTGDLSNPKSMQDPLSLHDTAVAEKVTNQLNSIDNMLGKDVQKAITDGTQKGIVIRANPELANKLDTLVQAMPQLEAKLTPVEKLEQQGQLAVEKERMLGNKASYDVVPSTNEEGSKMQNLMVRKGEVGQAPAEELVERPNEMGEGADEAETEPGVEPVAG